MKQKVGLRDAHKSQTNIAADLGLELQFDVKVEANLQPRMAGLACSRNCGRLGLLGLFAFGLLYGWQLGWRWRCCYGRSQVFGKYMVFRWFGCDSRALSLLALASFLFGHSDRL